MLRGMGPKKEGKWDWRRERPPEGHGRERPTRQYDNRRLMAAQQAGLPTVPIEIVNPSDIMPGSKKDVGKGVLAEEDDKGQDAGGVVPEEGLKRSPRSARNDL
jgi:hypothetical protein